VPTTFTRNLNMPKNLNKLKPQLMKNWQDYIESQSGEISGKALIKGKDVTVEYVVERLRDFEKAEDLMEEYGITEDEIRACLVYKDLYEKPYVLSEAEKKAIEKAERQIEVGNFYTNNEVNKMMDELLYESHHSDK